MNSDHAGILRRKVRPPPSRRTRDSAADLWRRILPRLAAEEMALELAVSAVREDRCDLHADLTAEEGALLLFLGDGPGVASGLAVLDAALLATLIEVQTTGRVSAQRREPRRGTSVDAALAGHVVDTWLAAISEARGNPAPPFTAGAAPDLRTALLKLEEGDWAATVIDLDFGGGKRSGRLAIYLPLPASRSTAAATTDAIHTAVLPVETTLEAVLCRIRVPLGTIVGLELGQVVHLPGVSLRRIALEAPRGQHVSDVHLGQSRGYRAVRILAADAEAEVTPPPTAQADQRDMLPDLEAGAGTLP
jgi:flagellar motor switch protein FliM